MQNRKYIGFILLIIMLWVISGCGNNNISRQDHYTADIVMGDGKRIMQGKFYAQQSRYRLESVAGLNQVVVIVDEPAEQMYILSPKDKSYRLLNTGSRASIASDPFQAARYARRDGKSEILGKETLQGYDCEKTVVSIDGLEIVTLWYAAELKWPIKSVEMGGGTHFMELSNISEGVVDNSLFEIPSDYKKVEFDQSAAAPDDPDPRATEFTVKSVSAPVKLPVKRGEELRVKVDPAGSVYIRFNNLAQKAESECVVSFFLEGKEVSSKLVGSEGYRTVLLKELGMATSNTWDAPADEVVIRVLRGFMQLEVRKP